MRYWGMDEVVTRIGFVLVVSAAMSSVECCNTARIPQRADSRAIVRVATLDWDGKVELDVQKCKLTAFGSWLGDQAGNWGLMEASISEAQTDSVAAPLNRADLLNLDLTGTEFKPVQPYIDERPSVLVVTWSCREKVFAVCPRNSIESVPESLRAVYNLFLDTCGRLNELQYEFWKGPFCTNQNRELDAQVTQVPRDDPRRARFDKEAVDAYARSLPRCKRD